MKKFTFLLCVCICLILNINTVFSYNDGENANFSGILIYGDIDNDGDVDYTDLRMIESYCMGLLRFDTRQSYAADINNDAMVTMIDYTILKYWLDDATDERLYHMKDKVAGGIHNGNFEWILYEKDYFLDINSWNFGWHEAWWAVENKIEKISFASNIFIAGGNIFKLCSNLKYISVDSASTSLSAEDNILYNKDKSTIITVPATRTGEFTILDSVKTIGNSAFYNSSISTLFVPDSVTTIEQNAFYGCSQLTDVYYEGTKEQWEAIENNSLSNVKIHYNYSTTTTTYTKDSDKNTITLNIVLPDKEIPDDSKVIIAGINGFSLKTVVQKTVSSGTVESANISSEDIQQVKIFVWDSLNNMKPLTYSETVNIQ